MVIEKDSLYKKERTSNKRTIKKSSKRMRKSSKRRGESSQKNEKNKNISKEKLYSHKRYKWFKSTLQYALDWKDCQRLIPLNDKNVLNTLKYMFYKFKSGVFIEIKDNKIYKFVPFYNIHFKNTWSDKIEGNTENFIKKYYKKKEKIIIRDKTQWTALNCKIKFMLLNSQDEQFHQFKYLLELILKKKKLKIVNFFLIEKIFQL